MTAVSNMENSMTSLADRNTEMQSELLEFHKQRRHDNNPLQLVDDEEDENDGIPRDSVALSRRTYQQQHLGEDDADSTAAESSSESSFGASFSSLVDAPRPRKVRFAAEYDAAPDSPLVVQYYESSEPISAEERQELWYRAEDFRYFRKYSRKLAAVAAASSYGKQLEDVLELCSHATTQDVTHCSRIANTGVRGLEVVVSERLIQSRQAAIRGVLEAAQTALNAEDLCATSRALSRSGRLLARILGNGDAAIARALARD